jgi:hypothetical protein
VETDQPAAVGGEPLKQRAAGRGGLIRDMVGHRPPVRMLERDQWVRQRVGANQQAYTGAAKAKSPRAIRPEAAVVARNVRRVSGTEFP